MSGHTLVPLIEPVVASYASLGSSLSGSELRVPKNARRIDGVRVWSNVMGDSSPAVPEDDASTRDVMTTFIV